MKIMTPSTLVRSLVVAIFAALLAGTLWAQAPQVYKIGDPGIAAPRLVQQVQAEYTEEAKDRHITGDVNLSFEIDDSGKPRNIKVVQGLDPALDKNAVSAFAAWRFEPATKDGKPVICSGNVLITFRLQ